jgi:hypothetical protein
MNIDELVTAVDGKKSKEVNPNSQREHEVESTNQVLLPKDVGKPSSDAKMGDSKKSGAAKTKKI